MFLLYPLLLATSIGTTLSKEGAGVYTNEFAVKILGGHQVAKGVALRHGFQFIDQIGALLDYYLFKESTIPTRSKRTADTHIKYLNDDPEVKWFKQQITLVRSKRDLSTTSNINDKPDKTCDKPGKICEKPGKTNDKPGKINRNSFNDPLWKLQWYLFDSPKKSMNVLPVWNRGITGHGVVVSILDDGIEWNNDDLIHNYDEQASTDLNDNDPDPDPRYDGTDFNSHGTRCAGEVASAANNGKCGVGVAFNASIGGVRMLDGEVTDSLEARAFGHNNDYIDIYSCSWGPEDDSMTLEGPNELAFDAIEQALEEGRKGKGNIFVWASGNGGYNGDDCSCDGYVSNIGTIAIGSVEKYKEKNQIPGFVERCASVMAATYSYGGQSGDKISTTDLNNGCTSDFCGTSASAPLAAGIIALALEKNPDLSWRDIQHIIVWTSKRDAIKNVPGWFQNAAGLWVNRAVGFGLMDAEAIVEMADPKTWKTVPKRNMCIIDADDAGFTPRYIPGTEKLTVPVDLVACRGTKDHVRYLEHVELFVDIEYPCRGCLNINLTSNSGTEITLLSRRTSDYSTDGFYFWPFMSVHTWGEETTSEDNIGTWNITIWDSVGNINTEESRVLNDLFLIFHGTETLPAHRQNTKPTKSKQKKSDIPVEVEHSSKETRESHDGDDDVIIKRRLKSKSKRTRAFLHSLHRS